jgi:hypothetical protein
MSVSQSDRGSVSGEFAGLPMPTGQDLESILEHRNWSSSSTRGFPRTA